MNLDYIEQQDIGRRYLQGKLSAAENALFEEFILDKPELITRLELDGILLNNLSKSNGKSKPLVAPLSISLNLHDVWKFGLAAAIGALMVLPFVQQHSLDYLSTGQLEGHNHIAYLESTRSVSTTTKSIIIAADAQQLILMIQPATLDENVFAITLKQNDDKYASTYSTQSKLANSGDLIVTIPANMLNQGTYELTLTGLNSAFKQTFVFELTRAKA